MNNDVALFLSGVICLGFGVLFPLLFFRASRGFLVAFSAILAMAGAVCVGLSSVLTLVHLGHQTIFLPTGQKIFGTFSLSLDPLAAFFNLMLSVAIVPNALYTMGYWGKENPGKMTPVYCAFYNLFLLSMFGVFSASHAVLFLVSWECMSLASFFFILTNRKHPGASQAGFLYLLMTHVATACLLLVILFLSGKSGSYSFSEFHQVGPHLVESARFFLFILTLVGFGTKAGLYPLNIWLPEAHPAAPSNISALMSGIMIKTGVYGILRFLFSFLSPIPFEWGFILAAGALVTAFLGIVFAFPEKDLKRLLAFSSIENIGIILLPVGICLVYWGLGSPTLAGIALIPVLLHSLNHAVFKSLLFMGAGSVLTAVHTVNMEKLGGLMRKMPKTGMLFLVGALAACCFPPFGAFVSKWMIFQTLLEDFPLHSVAAKIFTPFSAALLGLIGALAAATYVKAFSSVFSAIPRSETCGQAQESPPSMLWGMGLLAGLALLMGPLSAFIITPIKRICFDLMNIQPHISLVSPDRLFIQPGYQEFAELSPILILVLLVVIFLLAMLIPRLFGGKTSVRKDMTWSCGVTPSSDFEPTPTGLVQPLAVVFKKPLTLKGKLYEFVYLPFCQKILQGANRLKIIQAGNLQVYIAYIFVTLIVCLIWVQF